MLFFLFTSNKSQFCAFFFFCFSNFCFTYIEQCSLRFGIGRSANLAPIERYSSPILHTHSHFRSDLFNLWLLYADRIFFLFRSLHLYAQQQLTVVADFFHSRIYYSPVCYGCGVWLWVCMRMGEFDAFRMEKLMSMPESVRKSNKGQQHQQKMIEHFDISRIRNILICRATYKISVSEHHGNKDWVVAAREPIYFWKKVQNICERFDLIAIGHYVIPSTCLWHACIGPFV